MTVELSDFKSHSYIYDFKYDKSKFSGLDKVVEAYAKQAEKNGWEITAMAEAFKKAIEAGRTAYLAKLGRVIEKGAVASSPLTGFLQD